MDVFRKSSPSGNFHMFCPCVEEVVTSSANPDGSISSCVESVPLSVIGKRLVGLEDFSITNQVINGTFLNVPPGPVISPSDPALFDADSICDSIEQPTPIIEPSKIDNHE